MEYINLDEENKAMVLSEKIYEPSKEQIFKLAIEIL